MPRYEMTMGDLQFRSPRALNSKEMSDIHQWYQEHPESGAILETIFEALLAYKLKFTVAHIGSGVLGLEVGGGYDDKLRQIRTYAHEDGAERDCGIGIIALH
jgi:hypothetical protein